MRRHSVRLGGLLAVATFLGCPPAGPPPSEGTSGGGAPPVASEATDYAPFDRASALSVGMIQTQDLAVGGCTAAITETMEVELVKNNNKTGGTAWLVLNECGKELVATITDFTLNNVSVEAPVKCKSFPRGTDDFSVKLAEGEFGVISCRAKPGNDGDYRYKYSVKYDNKVADPDIIIKRR